MAGSNGSVLDGDGRIDQFSMSTPARDTYQSVEESTGSQLPSPKRLADFRIARHIADIEIEFPADADVPVWRNLNRKLIGKSRPGPVTGLASP